MVADLWQKKAKITDCFKSSISVVLRQFENKGKFSKNGFWHRIEIFITFCEKVESAFL